MFSQGKRWKFLGALAGLLMAVPVIRAQSISPVIVEYREKAKGQLWVTNDTLYPMDVVLEAFSFRVDESGEPHYGPLERDIRVRFSPTGFRLGPLQHYAVSYEALAEPLPAWFTIYATVTRADSRSDLRVAMQLPHTVYILPRKSLEREAVLFHRAERGANGQIHVEIENGSEEFARVQEVEVISTSGKTTYPGFPFFPRQRRILSLEVDPDTHPQRVILKFARFKLEQPIHEVGESP
jgi:hypothetical protein